MNLLGTYCTIQKLPERNKIKINVSQYNPKLVGEFKSLEGSKFEGSNIWTCKDTPRNNFTIDLLSGGPYSKLYSVPLISSRNELEESMWEHQRRSFKEKINKYRVIDAGEMGIGKTLSTLKALQYFREVLKWTGTIWWIAPNSGLTSLRTQIKKWGFTFRGATINICGERTQGDKIFNYHGLEREMEKAIDPPQMLVLDECHALKNASARRTQLAMQLSILMEQKWGKDCAVIGLTGTPASEDFFDWWSICEVVRPGWLKEPSFNQYKFRIANFSVGQRADGGGFPQFDGWKKHTQGNPCNNKGCEVCDILPRRLSGLVFVTWKKDCLDLPEKVYEERILPVSEATRRVAQAIGRMGLRAIEVQSRLRQLSDGFQYELVDEDAGEIRNASQFGMPGMSEFRVVEEPKGLKKTNKGKTPKDDALREILEEHKETRPHRLVVYAAFIASVDRCVEIAKEEGWTVWRYDGRGQHSFYVRDRRGPDITESMFQDPTTYPEPICFVGNPEAAGQGLTLTPAPTVVYYSNSFKGQYRVQSEDRIHRPGASKERGCRIIDLIHLPTDKLILDRLRSKRDAELITLEEINATLSNKGMQQTD